MRAAANTAVCAVRRVSSCVVGRAPRSSPFMWLARSSFLLSSRCTAPRRALCCWIVCKCGPQSCLSPSKRVDPSLTAATFRAAPW
jgi:hypothetical protein